MADRATEIENFPSSLFSQDVCYLLENNNDAL